ncbi:MAG: type II toxin-antitoxin system VapC family toxin [Deltaproteobacteria bacterium]|nr:type II toxin-antitoxin system VapC family toxin [Deltaproteobacteria bacterium]
MSCSLEGEDFWAHYVAAAKGQRIHGALVPDSALAALLRQHGINVLYTADAGFRRFPFTKVINPFEQ